jgi:hypothetical protein
MTARREWMACNHPRGRHLSKKQGNEGKEARLGTKRRERKIEEGEGEERGKETARRNLDEAIRKQSSV